MGAPHSPKPQHHWNLIICLLSVISRTLIGGVLPLCKGAVSVFYSPSRLGNLLLQSDHTYSEKCNNELDQLEMVFYPENTYPLNIYRNESWINYPVLEIFQTENTIPSYFCHYLQEACSLRDPHVKLMLCHISASWFGLVYLTACQLLESYLIPKCLRSSYPS